MVVWALYLGMFAIGLVLLITGKVQVSKRKAVQGMKARLIGLMLCAAVPLTFVITIGMAVVAVASGMTEHQAANSLLLILTPVGCLIGIALLAAILLKVFAEPTAGPGGGSSEKGFVFTPPGDVRPTFSSPEPPPSDNPYEPPATRG